MDFLSEALAREQEQKTMAGLQERKTQYGRKQLPELEDILKWYQEEKTAAAKAKKAETEAIMRAFAYRNMGVGSEIDKAMGDTEDRFKASGSAFQTKFDALIKALEDKMSGESEQLSSMRGIEAFRPVQEKTQDYIAGDDYKGARDYLGGQPSAGDQGRYIEPYKQKMLPNIAEILRRMM